MTPLRQQTFAECLTFSFEDKIVSCIRFRGNKIRLDSQMRSDRVDEVSPKLDSETLQQREEDRNKRRIPKKSKPFTE